MSNTILQAGWKLVPIEPNDEMQAAGAGAIRFATSPLNKLWTGNAVYRAQIAAAPAAPHAAAPMVWAAQLERAVRGLLPICGWSNMDEDDLILEACLGNGAAPLILFARAVLAGEVDMGIAPPEAPVWSACTEPDGRGYQQTVAMPGMPSATRDAAYDEIAALAVQWGDARIPNGGGNALRNFAEYVLARKSIAAPAPSLPAPSAWIDQFGNVFPLAAYSVDGTPNYHDQHKRGWSPLYRAQPAPVQQAAQSGLCAVQGAEKLPLCVGTCAKQGLCIEQAAPSELTADLTNLLNAIRPNFGDVGTRDVYVAAQRHRIDRAIIQLGLIMAHDGREHPTPRPTAAAAPAQPAGLSEQARIDAAAPDLLAACNAAIAYDRAIHKCANDPVSMASFCTAEGDDLDALYARWISLARAAIAKAAP